MYLMDKNYLVGNSQSAAIKSGVVLNQWVNDIAVGGEIGNHIGFTDDELAVQNVVVGVVAEVDDKGEVDHEACGVAVAVGTGIGFVGRHTVEGQELGVALAVHDDASACALHISGDVNPAAHEIQVIILHGVGVDGDGIRQYRPIGILGNRMASVKEG